MVITSQNDNNYRQNSFGRFNSDKFLSKGGLKMATQLQPTPTLYGKDALAVLEEIKKKPTEDQLKAIEQRRALFAKIKKRSISIR
ncbi:MAG: hypothetical protein K6T65_01445 [Peptococcaceae bacterium]|nr:hypothetical protein [Peptococcaceae bacterium]